MNSGHDSVTQNYIFLFKIDLHWIKLEKRLTYIGLN